MTLEAEPVSPGEALSGKLSGKNQCNEYEHNTKYAPSGENRQSCKVCLNASEKFICIVIILVKKQ